MIKDFLDRYEQSLIDQNTKEVTEKVTKEIKEKVTKEIKEKVAKKIAKNFKDDLPDEKIAECTGLSLKEVQNL